MRTMIRKWIEKAVDRYLVSHDDLAQEIVKKMYESNEYHHLVEAFDKAELMEVVDLEDLACEIDMADLAYELDEEILVGHMIDSVGIDTDKIANHIQDKFRLLRYCL